MKKVAITLFALAAAAALAAPAFATSLFTDAFGYADGALTTVGAPTWTTFSGAGTDIQVVSGRANGNNANAPDDAASFTAQATTVPTYFCFNVSIADPGAGHNPINTYFAMLKDNTTSTFFSRVMVNTVTGGGGYTFGIAWSSMSTTVGPTLWGSTLSYGTVYTVAVKNDPATKTSTLWVNPASEGSTSVANTGTLAATSISGVALREGAVQALPATFPTGDTAYQWSVDKIGVGTTFNDACAANVTAARTSTWGQMKSIYK